MKKRILSILLTMCMVLSLVPQTAFAEENTSTAPSVSTYATKTQLMDGTFAPKYYGKADNYGKLVFGKKSDGTTPQEWYILGKDGGVTEGTNNTVIFAASPIATGQVIEKDWGYDKTFDPKFGTYASNPSVVLSNHYGASLLRKALQNMATNTDYFTTAEQNMINLSTVETTDKKNNVNYTTTDKLYALTADGYGYGYQTVKAGSNNDKVLLRTTYWGNGNSFWIRRPDDMYDDAALAADPDYGIFNTHISRGYDVRPAANLDLSSVLFASAATAASSGAATSGTIASDKAMTLRLDGSNQDIGAVAYNPASGIIEATKGSITNDVSLVVQGNDGTNNWYYSKQITGTETVNVSDIKSSLGLSSNINLSVCKIWLEITGIDGMIYAVKAVKGFSTEAELREALDAGVTSITLTGDITLTSALVLSDKIFTLDLNGHTLTGDIKVTAKSMLDTTRLILTDSNPAVGGVLKGDITLTKESLGLTSSLYANGGTVTGQVDISIVSQIYCKGSTPTSFKGSVSGTGEIHGGIFYGDVSESCIKEKTVTFMNDDSRYAIEVVVAGNKAVAPVDPVKAGYILKGWYDGNSKYGFTEVLTSNITLSAKWFLHEISSVTELQSALDAGATTIKLVADITLSSALTLSDKMITLDLNGHTLTGDIKLADTASDTVSRAKSTILTLIDSNPTAGGVLNGNITLGSGNTGTTNHLYANGGTVTGQVIMNNDTAKIYCKSSTPTAFNSYVGDSGEIHGGIFYGRINKNSIKEKTVTFMNGESSYAFEVVEKNNNVVAPIPPSVKAGYQTFDGWYSGNSKYTFGFALSENITLNAKFGNPITYNINYNLDGGTAANPTSYTVESEAIKLNNPTKTGYTFIGWSGTGLSSNYNKDVTIAQGSTGNRTYTAHFSQNSYTVVFNTVGGSDISNKTGINWTDKVLSDIGAPTKAGYTFAGWKYGNMTVNANTTYKQLASSDTVTSIELTAQWEAMNYTVKFNTDGGNAISDKTNINWTDKVLNDIGTPTKAGYTFAGWKYGETEISANPTYGELAVEDTVMSIELTAQWEAKNFTVKFNTDGGNAISDKTGVNWTDEVLNDIGTPTKAGYTFAGWKYGETEISANPTYGELAVEDTVMSIELTAQWEAKNFTVKFNTDGGNAISDKTGVKWTDEVLSGITAPTKDGWEFTGWKCADTTVTAQTTYSELALEDTVISIELTAQWKDITAPTGEISIDTNKWTEFLNNITFGLFFKDTQEVTITASDNSGDTVTIEYLLSANELPFDELDTLTFMPYTEPFSISPDKEYVVYAKLTDTSGNVTYINSNGMVLDATNPVISGLQNGKTYCSEQTVTITEEYLESVTVNGEEVTLDNNNQFTLSPAEGEQTIVVTDKADNVSAEMIVTVNDGHTYQWHSENGQYFGKCEYCGDETAKKDIPTLTIDGADKVNRTHDYKFSFAIPEGVICATYGYEFENKGGAGLKSTIENGKMYVVIPSDIYEPEENSFKVIVEAKTDDGFVISVSKTVTINPTVDIDGDGRITMLDVVMLQKAIAKLVEFTPTQSALADVNGDGEFTMVDVVLIQRYIAKLITSFD